MTQPNEPSGATPSPVDPTAATPPPPGPTPPQWAAVSAPGVSGPVVAPGSLDVPTAPVTTVRRPSRRRGAIDVVLVVAAIFAIGGVGFAAGRVTAPASQAASTGLPFQGGQFPGGGTGNGATGNGANGTGQGGFFGGRGAAAGFTVQGEVTEATADHLTLKLTSGQTIQIPVDTSTTYHTQTAATASDVTTGSTVEVQISRGPANGGTAGGTGNGTTGGGRLNLGPATSVTVIPK